MTPLPLLSSSPPPPFRWNEQFEADGYLVVPRFFSQDQASELLERSRTLLREFDLEGHPMTKFHGTADVDQVRLSSAVALGR